VWSKDTTKKEENGKLRKKGNRKPESKESVCQGLSLVPIHRDAQIDLKTEMEVWSKDTTKKEKLENQEEERNKIPEAKEHVCQE
jgi:hypothetical protein